MCPMKGKPMTVRPLRRMSHAEETVSIQAVLPDGWIAKSRNLCLCGRSTCGPHVWDIEDAWAYGVTYGCVTEMTMHRGFEGDVALPDPDKSRAFATAVEAALWVVHRWRELDAREG